MMSEFKWIKFKNIGSVGDDIITVDFDVPLQVISGHNGQGKSTIIQAISYNLLNEPYAKTARSLSLEDLINNRNNKGLYTESCIMKGDVEYIISRGMKPDVYEIKENGEVLNIEGKKGMQEMIYKIIGKDKKELRQMTFFSLDFYQPFLDLDTDQRRTFMREFFNLDIYDDIKDLVKSDTKDLKDKMSSYKSKVEAQKEILDEVKSDYKANKKDIKNKLILFNEDIDAVTSEINDVKESINELNYDPQYYKELNDKHTSYVKDISIIENKITSNKEKIYDHDDLSEQIISLSKDLYGFDLNDLNDTKQKLDAINETISNDKDIINTIKIDIEKLKSKIETQENNNKLISKKTEELKKLNIESNKLSNSLTMKLDEALEKDLYDKCNKLKVEIKSIEIDLKKREKDMQEFNDIGDSCPFCYSKIENEFKSRILNTLFDANSKINKELISLKEKYNTIDDQYTKVKMSNENYEKIINDIKVIQYKIDDIKKSIDDIHIDDYDYEKDIKIQKISFNVKKQKIEKMISDRDDLKRNLSALSDNQKKYIKVDKLKDQLARIDIKKLSNEIINLENDIAKLKNKKIKNLKNIDNEEKRKEEYQSYKDDISKLKKDIDDIKNNKANLKNILLEKKSNVDAVKNKIEELDDEYVGFEKEYRINDALSFIVGDGGIKRYIIGKYIPSLNTLFHKYATILESSFMLKMNYDMSIEILDKGNIRKYYSFSGGERNQINLIILLSFIEMSRLMHGGSFNLLLLDEITAPLDADNTHKMFQLLTKYFDELSILLITHKDTDKEMGFIDRRIRVKKDKSGFSKYKII